MKIKFKKIVDLFVNIKNNYPVTLLFTVGNFINAIVLRLFTTGSFGIRALFLDFTFVMIMTGISFLIKKMVFDNVTECSYSPVKKILKHTRMSKSEL